MDVCADSKPEGPKRHGEGDVQGGHTRGVPQAKALVGNVSRVSDGAHHPRRQAPRLSVSRRYREHDADGGIEDSEENDRANPRLTRTNHAHLARYTLTRSD